MIKLTDVIYGLALYYVLFSANVLIGGEKFCGGRKFWKRCDDDSWLTFFFRGLYVFGAVCTGIVLDMAYTSGVWYGVYAEIIKVMFELLLIVTPVLKLFGGEKVRSCIHTHFRLDAFLFCSMVLGVGCFISYILLHSGIFI